MERLVRPRPILVKVPDLVLGLGPVGAARGVAGVSSCTRAKLAGSGLREISAGSACRKSRSHPRARRARRARRSCGSLLPRGIQISAAEQREVAGLALRRTRRAHEARPRSARQPVCRALVRRRRSGSRSARSGACGRRIHRSRIQARSARRTSLFVRSLDASRWSREAEPRPCTAAPVSGRSLPRSLSPATAHTRPGHLEASRRRAILLTAPCPRRKPSPPRQTVCPSSSLARRARRPPQIPASRSASRSGASSKPVPVQRPPPKAELSPHARPTFDHVDLVDAARVVVAPPRIGVVVSIERVIVQRSPLDPTRRRARGEGNGGKGEATDRPSS